MTERRAGLLVRLLGGVPGTARLPELPLADLTIDPAKHDRFETFTERAIATDADLPYDLAEPKHEYLRWLATHRDVLFHGAPGHPRDLLEPRRATGVDKAGRQNAVYGTPWPVMAMWFAILNKGSRRFVYTINGSRAVDATDFGRRLYWFKVNPGARSKSSFTIGTIHVVDKSPFVIFELADGVVRPGLSVPLPGEPAIEWICESAVRPLFRLVYCLQSNWT